MRGKVSLVFTICNVFSRDDRCFKLSRIVHILTYWNVEITNTMTFFTSILKISKYSVCVELVTLAYIRIARTLLKIRRLGVLGWLSRLSNRLLILAQVMISRSWDRAPHRTSCSVESLFEILSLPLPLPLLVHSLKQINKSLKKIRTVTE